MHRNLLSTAVAAVCPKAGEELEKSHFTVVKVKEVSKMNLADCNPQEEYARIRRCMIEEKGSLQVVLH